MGAGRPGAEIDGAVGAMVVPMLVPVLVVGMLMPVVVVVAMLVPVVVIMAMVVGMVVTVVMPMVVVMIMRMVMTRGRPGLAGFALDAHLALAASAYAAHQPTSSSLIVMSWPPVTCSR